MPDPHADLIRAARKRERADEEYRELLEEKIAGGASYVELARVLGVSRQGIRQLALRGKK